MGANQPYKETDSSKKTYDLLVCIVSRRFLAELELKFVNQSVKYGTGSVRGQCSLARVPICLCLHPIPGREYQDTVTITPGVTIQQSIGVARKSIGIYPCDGILG